MTIGHHSRSRSGCGGSIPATLPCGSRTNPSTAMCICHRGRRSTPACFTVCAVITRSGGREASAVLYVERWRRESAGYRERANAGDDLAQRLHPSWSARQDDWPTRPTCRLGPPLRPRRPGRRRRRPPGRKPHLGARWAESDGEPHRPRGVAWTLPHCCGNEPYRKKSWLTLNS
jgi:hypothetical protein